VPNSEPPPEETQLNPTALAVPQFRSHPRVDWVDASGHFARIIEGRVVVGSAPGSGIVVDDPTVSRLHAEFEAREDGLWVRDLGSRNGTYIEGLLISGGCVPQSGRVRLGSTDFVVDYTAGQQQPVDLWPQDRFGKLLGRSAPMRELFARIARIAPMDASVFIQGETGTGKELVARAIHDASPRGSKPFVVVDCAALPENLLDAELFGHAKGAYTGAVGARSGAIESADGGTVFLDEIGELPIPMQPKLLRVLESRTVRRIGETGYREVDVRFIAATHRDLLTMVSAGEFREDLYFRLSVLPISLPPLRDRRDDIELLANQFMRLAGADGHIGAEVLRELVNRPWRGNVRELRNFIERLRALGPTEALAMIRAAEGVSQKDLPLPPATISTAGIAAPPTGLAADDPHIFELGYKDFREAWIDAGEKEYVRRLLDRHGRSVAAAAKTAGIDRTYIYRLIRKHEL
jgi:two-component system, NtrC family, response regulator GlrR